MGTVGRPRGVAGLSKIGSVNLPLTHFSITIFRPLCFGLARVGSAARGVEGVMPLNPLCRLYVSLSSDQRLTLTDLEGGIPHSPVHPWLIHEHDTARGCGGPVGGRGAGK